MNLEKINNHIVAWLDAYCGKAGLSGFIVGISGGIDSAVTSTLCAQTGKKVLLLNMPIRQTKAEFDRGNEHIENLKARFPNVSSLKIDLTESFESLERIYPPETVNNRLAMANTRARLRMTTLYALGQSNNLLVTGTGNKIEDFGIGFYTKYGDGGVDISPIADLTKTQVFALAAHLGIVSSIQVAKPTDGLWEDGRSDEDQIGASYPELEWAMDFRGDENTLSERQREVLALYHELNRANQHKMQPIPVCEIPESFFD
ncbi:MAG: synthetase [Crocinitomicaceae bacterium]|nr:synthetase [Crocinitomicaceae bacterium]